MPRLVDLATILVSSTSRGNRLTTAKGVPLRFGVPGTPPPSEPTG